MRLTPLISPPAILWLVLEAHSSLERGMSQCHIAVGRSLVSCGGRDVHVWFRMAVVGASLEPVAVEDPQHVKGVFLLNLWAELCGLGSTGVLACWGAGRWWRLVMVLTRQGYLFLNG